ncbi:hypothetical protein GCM10009557_87590 [Virgisporangium ochraceum]|uniref:Uncharacterized protein n=1 Tax=Virgisporangium ochraceum TaxID=65505 RepID=A0A8J3ZYW7_9ACTN|nr:hypothetical protein Voc01_070830 [Virgisporangium ochraceum]
MPSGPWGGRGPPGRERQQVGDREGDQHEQPVPLGEAGVGRAASRRPNSAVRLPCRYSGAIAATARNTVTHRAADGVAPRPVQPCDVDDVVA